MEQHKLSGQCRSPMWSILVQHAKGELKAPVSGVSEPVVVNVLLDTRSGVMSVSEGLVIRLQQTHPGVVQRAG